MWKKYLQREGDFYAEIKAEQALLSKKNLNL